MHGRRLLIWLMAPACLMAELYPVQPKAYHQTLSGARKPLLTLRSSDGILVRVPDAAGTDEKGVRVTEAAWPVIGPFSAEAARPGDALTLTIKALKFVRGSGWSGYRISERYLTPEAVPTLYSNRFREGAVVPGRADLLPWTINVEKGLARPTEPLSRRQDIEVAVKPVVSILAVAPPGTQEAPTNVLGQFGGPFDCADLGMRATVTLPVYHPGALFYVGGGKAMAGTETNLLGGGIETVVEAEIRVGVLRKAEGFAPIEWPRIEGGSGALVTIGLSLDRDPSTDNAMRRATTEMLRWLIEEKGLEPPAAHILIATRGQFQVLRPGAVALRIAPNAVNPHP